MRRSISYEGLLADVVGRDPYDGRWPDTARVEQARMILFDECGWDLDDETQIRLLKELMAP